MATQQWTVIGAGASGILAVAKLIDAGIQPNNIVWIDPDFAVGDLNAKWSEVPSNTIVKLFVDYIKEMQCIEFSALKDCPLFHFEDNDTCHLSNMVAPLKECTKILMAQVNAIPGTVTHLKLTQRQWHIKTKQQEILSSNVIIANGATPSYLDLKTNIDKVSLEVALCPSKLKNIISTDDTVGVFGSSHSAILILKNLVDLNVKQIINFYLSPCQYALKMEGWTLFDNTGLKGTAAIWAKENIDGTLPRNIKRLLSTSENIASHLPQCNKLITATGFKTNDSIKIEGVDPSQYQQQTGIIAPGLFGFGIAFPEQAFNQFGIKETKVGLWKFATYLRKVLPIWLKYST